MEKLRKTRNHFTAIGYVSVNELSFVLDKENNNGNYCFSKANLKLNFNGDSMYFESFGGFNQDSITKQYKQTKIYLNNKNNNDMFVVDFEDRENEQIIEMASPNNFKKIGIYKDSDNKLEIKTFVTEYDMIKYLSENLEDGKLVKITGNINYQENSGKVYAKYIIKNLFVIDELRKNDQLGCYFNQEIIVTSDSVDLKNINDGEITINSTIVDYCSKLKENKPLHKSFYIKLNKDNPKEISAMSLFVKNYLKPEKETIRSIYLKCKITSSLVDEKISENDLTDDLKALIDAGFMTLEDVLQSTSSKTTSESKMYILEPVIIKNSSGKLSVDIDDQKYKDLEFENLDLENVPFFTEEKEGKQLDIDDLDSMLNGLLENN
jgi:hypothetical protein